MDESINQLESKIDQNMSEVKKTFLTIKSKLESYSIPDKNINDIVDFSNKKENNPENKKKKIEIPSINLENLSVPTTFKVQNDDKDVIDKLVDIELSKFGRVPNQIPLKKTNPGEYIINGRKLNITLFAKKLFVKG